MEDMKKFEMPAFGNWEYCGEMPITQYFESARQPGLDRACFFEEDLFKVPVAVPVYSSTFQHGGRRPKVRRADGGGEKKQCSNEQQKQSKQGKVGGVAGGTLRRPRVPKAVDEDLYKIPQELLYQKPKRKRLLRNLVAGCLGLNCIP
ncbi:hypothetical protein AXF42_Ash015134 [Apostasia shenzhenica]|uniref:Uncharacterized protein n=1 Tax=Apostasia shenzhenica TaxID=1088818 RepID=A0A2I0AQC6_9ASPA|nr:hypothetical protein AXF42_Ash015134 [Apostasia shenzhenica]